MDDEEWSLSMPYLQVNKENAKFHIDDEDGQSHRELLTGWEKTNGSGIKGKTVEVVHGFLAGGKGMPVTLVVFDWLLVPGKAAHRLKEVTIDVRFQAVGERDGCPPGDISDWDPVPLNVAPFEPRKSQFCKVAIAGKRTWELSATFGYPPYAAVQPKVDDETSSTVERIAYRYITGTPLLDGRTHGECNAVQWRFTENPPMQTGVQYRVKTAVLLKRKDNDFGKFVLAVQSSANSLDKFLKTLRLRKTDGLSTFDPTVKPSKDSADRYHKDIARRPTEHDPQNLGTVSLTDVLLDDPELIKMAKTDDDDKADS